MENKQENEVEFWKTLYSSKDDYFSFRKEDGLDKMKHFDGLINRDGIGVDVGCGLVSVFRGLENKIVAIDPLLSEYSKIVADNSDNVKYIGASGEEIPFCDGFFDYAFCVNVIDHTPNPDKMANEIKRVVKDGGLIYFEVNFDDMLSPCHYALWNKELVNKYFGDLKLKHEVLERNEADKQYLYYAIYENISTNPNI